MTTRPLSGVLAAGACDCHMHVFDPAWPLAASATAPAPPASTLQDYRAVQTALGLSRAVVVQSTAYGFDNRCMLDALATPRQADLLTLLRLWVADDAGSLRRILVDNPAERYGFPPVAVSTSSTSSLTH